MQKKKAFTIVDEFSKFLIVISVNGESAKVTAVSIVKYMFMRYGSPNKIHTDNATSFSNKVMIELTSRSGLNIQRVHLTIVRAIQFVREQIN